MVQSCRIQRACAKFAISVRDLRKCSAEFITGPGTVQNNMSLSKTMELGDTRSMEIRATINNAVQHCAVFGRGYQCRRRPHLGR